MDDSGYRAGDSTVVAMLALGGTVSCGLWAGLAGLFGADKISLSQFYVSTGISGLVFLGFGAAAFAQWRGWLGKMWQIPSRYVLSCVCLLVVISLPIASALYGNDLAFVLSIVPVVFMVYLWRTLLVSEPEQPHRWEYGFIEHLDDDGTKIYRTGQPRNDDPFLVYPVEDARSSTSIGTALFEHPPHDGDAVIKFHVADIPGDLTQLGIRGYYGLMDAFTDRHGTDKRTTFEPNTTNRLRFEVVVNNRPVLRNEVSDYGWIEIEEGPFQPRNGSLTVEFRTNAVGEAHCNWAAWRDIRLVQWD